MRLRRHNSGSSLLEFVFVGIPLIFVLISIFEVSRGMWIYSTLSHGVKMATRFAVVHGNNCTVTPNSCAVTMSQVCQVLATNTPGLLPTEVVNVRLQSFFVVSPAQDVNHATLTACTSGGATNFPAGDEGGSDKGGEVRISASYQFRSAIAMFWPGSGPGQNFGTLFLPAAAREQVRY